MPSGHLACQIQMFVPVEGAAGTGVWSLFLKSLSLFIFQKESSKSGNLKATFVAEEKIKKLKKRNSELVSIARQLEEKAKKLQEEKVQAQVCTGWSSKFSFILCYLLLVTWLCCKDKWGKLNRLIKPNYFVL